MPIGVTNPMAIHNLGLRLLTKDEASKERAESISLDGLGEDLDLDHIAPRLALPLVNLQPR